MRIEAGKHPAAYQITDVLVNGITLMRGTCIWVDLDRNEACVYCTEADGKLRIEDDEIVTRIISGHIDIRIPEQHRHLLSWGREMGLM